MGMPPGPAPPPPPPDAAAAAAAAAAACIAPAAYASGMDRYAPGLERRAVGGKRGDAAAAAARVGFVMRPRRWAGTDGPRPVMDAPAAEADPWFGMDEADGLHGGPVASPVVLCCGCCGWASSCRLLPLFIVAFGRKKESAAGQVGAQLSSVCPFKD